MWLLELKESPTVLKMTISYKYSTETLSLSEFKTLNTFMYAKQMSVVGFDY